mgnify:CR=1 FL=1
MSNEPCPHAVAAIEINVFDVNGVKSTQLFTNADADFRMSGREFTIDVKRAVTPAFVERAERAAVNAHVQAQRAELQAISAQNHASAAAQAVEAAKAAPIRRKTTRRQR